MLMAIYLGVAGASGGGELVGDASQIAADVTPLEGGGVLSVDNVFMVVVVLVVVNDGG